MTEPTLLNVKNLSIDYLLKGERIRAVDKVSFSLRAGEVVSIVGESGSGKSTLALALQGLLPANADVVSGEVVLNQDQLQTFSESAWKTIRGTRIAYIPQDPSTSLNPVSRNGHQVGEALVAHRIATRHSAREQSLQALRDAGVTDVELRYEQYPHQLSGGLKQRVLIAGAIIGSPTLIIADEPTSGLDVTVQKQILDHIGRLVKERDSSMILITHDLAVALDRSDSIIVMKQGEIVESGTTAQIFGSPQHPYTRKLLGHTRDFGDILTADLVPDPAPDPTSDQHGTGAADAPIVELVGLHKEFRISRHQSFTAVRDVSLTINRGETLALVGESGSGKTTISRIIAGLEKPSSGSVIVDGRDVGRLGRGQHRDHWRSVQMVYQNPYDSLDPTYTIRRILEEPLRSFDLAPRERRRAIAQEALERVALPSGFLDRKPGELSGGQRQRVAIARALIVNPRLVVLDEPVSALDATVQEQVLDLLKELKASLSVSFLFITHDLSLLPGFADSIVVLKNGEVKERGPVVDVYRSPRDPYTRQLISAIPGLKITT
ncbi:dipeptide ABC transporter ATP-binding protein [Corynebacterium pacaense]|uniref:dipeptide ABC transporter ATP-binding protein n=1 Tax=Corynebacterium pacaense TaxID=1816684 RepID=UPI0009B9C49A|nr:ABC transporter ATP-binding protein [Corynebacterium pacaense]